MEITEIKSPIPLNMPKNKKIQFNDVSFVNEMTAYSLKVFIKRMWQSLMVLANTFEGRRKDVPTIIDNIMSGKRWSVKDVDDQMQYGIYQDFIIRFDTLEKTFTLLNRDHVEIHPPVKAVSLTEAKNHAKELRNQRRLGNV